MKKYKISVYDVKGYLEENFKCENLVDYNKGIAIIQSDEDILVFDHEGCGFTTEDVISNMTFRTYKESPKDENGHWTLTEGDKYKLSLAEIIEKCNKSIVPLDQFINKDYNRRLGENYREIVGLLKDRKL